MTERHKTEWDERGGHTSEEDLRLYADGELDAQGGALVKAHLEACWSCRVKLDEVQETIADFINFRNQVLRPLVLPPPNNWRGFDSLLGRVTEAAEDRSLWAQFASRISRTFANLRALAASPLAIRFAVGLTLTVAVVAAWIVFNREPVVTAAELLRRGVESQTQKILSVSQPVIHQQIQISRKRGSLAQPETVKLETWNDLNHSRFRQSSGGYDAGSGRYGAGSGSDRTPTEPADMLIMLERIFRENRLDWRRPLSVVSFAEWRKSLRGRNEEIQRSRLADGTEALSLRTISTEPPRPGAILEATLTVRARDWSPFKQTLRVNEEAGAAEYELLETAFEVVSLAGLDPAIFPETQAANLPAATPMGAPSPIASPAPSSAFASASVSLEIETLALLSQARADLGEQVSVERTPEGALRIVGVVETEDRKQELKRALAPALGSPAVRFEIETVEEAMRRASQPAASSPVVIEQRSTSSGALPVEEELRRYLSGQGRGAGPQLDEEINRLAHRTVNSSFNIRQHAQALKRLGERFTPEQWRSFDEAARARLLGLIESQATAIRAQSHELRRSLQPIFKIDEPAIGAGAEIAGAPDLIRAINRLVELSATSDRAIQSAFTLSTEGAPGQFIQTPAFWNAIAGLEQIAGQIQTAAARLRK